MYKMLDFIQYLNLPTKAAIILVALYLALQIVGEILEFTGKVVPEFMKIRKYFSRKKQERKTMAEMVTVLAETKQLLQDVNAHYSTDNIAMRDGWMSSVNQQLSDTKEWREELDKKMDKNNAITLAILIENKRSEIINFASYVIDEKNPVTHEQFNRVFKLYSEYEDILKENKMTNGEAVVAMRIINEAYEAHMRKHSFVEDTRWHEQNM